MIYIYLTGQIWPENHGDNGKIEKMRKMDTGTG